MADICRAEPQEEPREASDSDGFEVNAFKSGDDDGSSSESDGDDGANAGITNLMDRLVAPSQANTLRVQQPPAEPTPPEVARLVWEVVRTADGCIRRPVEEQVPLLLGKFDELNVAFKPVPQDLQTAHRLLHDAEKHRESIKTASQEQHKLWYRYHMYVAYEGAAQKLQSPALRPVAAAWHSARRRLILKAHPEVMKLMGDDPATPLAMVLLVAAHLTVAVQLRAWAAAASAAVAPASTAVGGAAGLAAARSWGGWAVEWAVVWLAAAGFGAFAAFGFQALDHELSHAKGNRPWLAHALGALGSGCTAVPWFSYYFSGGHARHHRLAGSPQDIDREAFFWAWERVPPWLPDTPFGSGEVTMGKCDHAYHQCTGALVHWCTGALVHW